MASVSVVTHPAHRGRGAGTAVVSALAQWLLAEGLVPHYQTLHSNVPAVAAARHLGFVQTARTLSVRLRGVPMEGGRDA
ncbi:GNAT family N-acetyltransferase [Deinococcus sp.]|uniref:GNAT family N-acetyltransferase n=1 Tax=Deinococcus sp. TaxID=47478 RepID=UPI0038D4BD61